MALPLKLGCVWLLRGAWGMVPARWEPWLHLLAIGSAGMLPPRARRRVRRVIGRVRAQDAGIGQHYAAWVRLCGTMDQRTRRPAQTPTAPFAALPRISVVMPVFNPEPAALLGAIRSVERQSYPHWELCIADDASTDPDVAAVLRQAEARDGRIRIVWRSVNGHIAAASNSALVLARGDFVALFDHDDVLAPHALHEVACRIAAAPSLDILFSDEDKIDRAGRRFDPYFKPGWNPALLQGQNLISHLGVFRTSLLRRIGGFRPGLEGSQDYDLALRAVAETSADRIAHIPMVLYHWRQGGRAPSFSERSQALCIGNARKAVLEQLCREEPGTRVVAAPDASVWNRVVRQLAPNPPRVSVIVCAPPGAGYPRRCLDGLLKQTDYPALEVLVVEPTTSKQAGRALPAGGGPPARRAGDPRIRRLRWPGPFNHAALVNWAAAEASGALLLLLRDDIGVIHPDWLREMVSHATRPEVGAVGAKLLYPDDTVQHGGLSLVRGVAANPYEHRQRHDPGYFGHLALVRNVSAVTSACLMVRRTIFKAVGGLNERDLPEVLADVDFCLRVEGCGYRNVWTPFAELYRHGPVSYGPGFAARPASWLRRGQRSGRGYEYMERRWGDRLHADPYWNPNLARRAGELALAYPPRLRRVAEEAGTQDAMGAQLSASQARAAGSRAGPTLSSTRA